MRYCERILHALDDKYFLTAADLAYKVGCSAGHARSVLRHLNELGSWVEKRPGSPPKTAHPWRGRQGRLEGL